MEATFHPRVNLIYGDNAQGKTNLLEAIAYLSSARSHRARYDRELIMLDQPQVHQGRSRQPGAHLYFGGQALRGKTRQLWSNGLRLKTAGELAGILTTVLFCSEDLYLIREGAAARRRFLDGAICQLRPRYAQALAEYNRLYEHKTRILRDWQENPSLLDTLDDFNLRMAQFGAGSFTTGPTLSGGWGNKPPPSTPIFPAGGSSLVCGMRRFPPFRTR